VFAKVHKDNERALDGGTYKECNSLLQSLLQAIKKGLPSIRNVDHFSKSVDLVSGVCRPVNVCV
jgi:hypothetical protein